MYKLDEFINDIYITFCMNFSDKKVQEEYKKILTDMCNDEDDFILAYIYNKLVIYNGEIESFDKLMKLDSAYGIVLMTKNYIDVLVKVYYDNDSKKSIHFGEMLDGLIKKYALGVQQDIKYNI